MKKDDIRSFEKGNHCFGDILRVNGVDYDEIDEKEILEFVRDVFENDINKSIIIREVFSNLLDYLEYEIKDSSSYECDQCGNYNDYYKAVI